VENVKQVTSGKPSLPIVWHLGEFYLTEGLSPYHFVNASPANEPLELTSLNNTYPR
jgi:hypothetical protein